LNKLFKDNNIDFVVHLAKIRAPDQLDEGYVCRRAAVDFGIPLMNDSKVAALFVDACVRHRSDKPHTAAEIPDEVKSWSEYVDAKI
jgi:carbamoyl-phosphate synthase large subunit